jgi:quinol monooxygenase YgiN
MTSAECAVLGLLAFANRPLSFDRPLEMTDRRLSRSHHEFGNHRRMHAQGRRTAVPRLRSPERGSLADMVELHLRGRTAPGRRADLIAFLREAIPFYEAPGGIRVRLLWDVTDPERFIEVVEYADRDAYDRDQERVISDPKMNAYLARWRAFLAEAPQVETYRVDTPNV